MTKSKFDIVAKKLVELQGLIDEIQQEHPGTSTSLFSDLGRAIEFTLQKRNLYPQFFADAIVRPPREQTRIRNSRANLEKQKELLADIKRRRTHGLNNPGASETIPYEAVEKQEERVAIAAANLARAENRAQEHHDETIAAKLAKQREAGLAMAESQRAWQAQAKNRGKANE